MLYLNALLARHRLMSAKRSASLLLMLLSRPRSRLLFWLTAPQHQQVQAEPCKQQALWSRFSKPCKQQALLPSLILSCASVHHFPVPLPLFPMLLSCLHSPVPRHLPHHQSSNTTKRTQFFVSNSVYCPRYDDCPRRTNVHAIKKALIFTIMHIIQTHRPSTDLT